jgi:hypothetical protein
MRANLPILLIVGAAVFASAVAATFAALRILNLTDCVLQFGAYVRSVVVKP